MKQIDLGRKQIDLGRKQIDLGRKQIDLGWKQIDLGWKQIDLGWKQIDLGRKQIDLGWNQIDLQHIHYQCLLWSKFNFVWGSAIQLTGKFLLSVILLADRYMRKYVKLSP